MGKQPDLAMVAWSRIGEWRVAGKVSMAVCALIARVPSIVIVLLRLQLEPPNRYKILKINPINAALITQLKQLGAS